jgi:hypothetical protein
MGRTKLQIVASAWLCAAFVLTVPQCLAEGPAKPSPIESLADRLSVIFQFRIERGQLVLDRELWEAKAAVQRKAYRDSIKNSTPSDDPRQKAVEARRKAAIEQMLTTPALSFPIIEVWSELIRTEPQMIVQAGRIPRFFSRTAERFSCGFQGRAVRFSARGNDEAEKIDLSEIDSPRALYFADDPAEGFRLEVTDGDNNLIVFQQHPDSFAALILRDNQMLTETSKTFVEFVRKHRELANDFIFPRLARVGICLVWPIEDKKVSNAAMYMLISPQDADLDPDELIAGLESTDLDARTQTRRLLLATYEQHRQLIAKRLEAKVLSDDAQVELKKVVDSVQNRKVARQTVIVFDLLNEPEFLASLLNDADARETQILLGRLERATGEKLGTDPDAWKTWIRENKLRAKTQRTAE